MNIQRYDEDFDAADNTIGMSGKTDGKWCKHSDHLAAMKELEERMLRFVKWLFKAIVNLILIYIQDMLIKFIIFLRKRSFK